MLYQLSKKSLIAVFGLLVLMGWMDSRSLQADWKEKWDKTLTAAKKEGQVVLYGGVQSTLSQIERDF